MTDPVIKQRFAAHMRLQGGSAYVYDLLDGQGRARTVMQRVGRRKAGWLLDGVEHKNFPAALAA